MTTLAATLETARLVASATDESACDAATPAVAEALAPLAPLTMFAGRSDASDEDSLCADALLGDRRAWNSLIERHSHRLVVSLLARGVRVDRAHELAQETWLILIQRQRAGRLQLLKLPGLAIAQAQFLAREDYRRGGAHPTAPFDEAFTAGALTLDPEERLLAREQLTRARAVLAGCSRSTQTVFHLLYETPGLSHADAARHAGLSLQRVRQILCNLRKKLRAAVLEEEESPDANE